MIQTRMHACADSGKAVYSPAPLTHVVLAPKSGSRGGANLDLAVYRDRVVDAQHVGLQIRHRVQQALEGNVAVPGEATGSVLGAMQNNHANTRVHRSRTHSQVQPLERQHREPVTKAERMGNLVCVQPGRVDQVPSHDLLPRRTLSGVAARSGQHGSAMTHSATLGLHRNTAMRVVDAGLGEPGQLRAQVRRSEVVRDVAGP